MSSIGRTVALVSIFLVPLTGTADDEGAARKARLEQIRRVLETLRPTLLLDDEESEISLHSTPALLYADNARDLSDSSLWVWEHDGQPVGLTAIEWNAGGQNQGRWTFEFAGLSSEKIRITPASWKWTTEPTRAAPLANSPAIAGARAQRLQQMKKLAERFGAFEVHPFRGRNELRRLAAPVYIQPEDGDSALFVFAHGTNPEIALLITSVRDDNGNKTWGYRAAPLSVSELTLLLDDQKVWSRALYGAEPSGDYVNGVLKVE